MPSPGLSRQKVRITIDAWERATRLATATSNPTLQAHATLLAFCWRILVNAGSERDGQKCEEAAASLRKLGADMPDYGRLLFARALL